MRRRGRKEMKRKREEEKERSDVVYHGVGILSACALHTAVCR